MPQPEEAVLGDRIITPITEDNGEDKFKCIRRTLSPFQWSDASVIVGYVIYEAGARVTSYNFNVFAPLLVNKLGDLEFGDGKGKLVWGYVSVIYAITTILAYLSATSVMEYSGIKRKSLIRCGTIGGIAHLLNIFCFSAPTVYLAVFLVVLAKTSIRVADVAFDSMLDVASKGTENPHQVSSRATITGYCGMVAFLPFVLPVVGIVYLIFKPSSVWTLGAVPILCTGLWYLAVVWIVDRMLPVETFMGPPAPFDADLGSIEAFRKAIVVGLTEQISNFTYLQKFPDLGLFILSLIFLANGAATAQSIGIILATDELELSLGIVAGAIFVGLICAIIGASFFKYLNQMGWLSAKQIILVNMSILVLCSLYILNVYSTADVFGLAIVSGFQIGSVQAFSRSIITSLTPAIRQSRLFSFYNLSQDGTAWIGPLIISSIVIAYGDKYFREVVVYVCMVQFGLGLPILMLVNVEKGESRRKEQDSVDSNSLVDALPAEESPQKKPQTPPDD